MNIISFDFDDTLALSYEKNIEYDDPITIFYPNPKALTLLNKHIANGDKVIIVTTRRDAYMYEVYDFLKEHNIPIEKTDTYNTNLGIKCHMLKDLHVNVHYDDNQDELDLLKDTGIKGIHINA
jgi:acid phosphatase class B